MTLRVIRKKEKHDPVSRSEEEVEEMKPPEKDRITFSEQISVSDELKDKNRAILQANRETAELMVERTKSLQGVPFRKKAETEPPAPLSTEEIIVSSSPNSEAPPFKSSPMLSPFNLDQVSGSMDLGTQQAVLAFTVLAIFVASFHH